MNKKIVAVLFFACALYSCGRILYIPESTNPEKQKRLLTGRQLYVDHCSSCHNLHLPREYGDEGWKKQLDEMQVKAKITNEEKNLIFNYLTFQGGNEEPK
jgi:mono/diheme cytochrome c family protein